MDVVFCSSHAIAKLFSSDECAAITKICETYPVKKGLVWTGNGYGVDSRVRDLKTAYVPRNDKTEWIFDRMDQLFFRVASKWKISVDGTVEDLKFMVYRKGSHFASWHSDVGPDYSSLRRLSVSVELCGSSEYDGGDLQIFPTADGHLAGPRRKSGTAIVFPSHLRHRVTPVTRGVRKSLVNWISAAAVDAIEPTTHTPERDNSAAHAPASRGTTNRVSRPLKW